jgi:hypothetical protein
VTGWGDEEEEERERERAVSLQRPPYQRASGGAEQQQEWVVGVPVNGQVIGVGQELVELLVVLLADALLGQRPQRAHRVDPLPVELDGEAHKVGVLLDDAWWVGG